MDKLSKISVIVPAFNEEQNIEPLVESFNSLINKIDHPLELVLVDDGSTDGTLNKALDISNKSDYIKVVSYRTNHGKTYAVLKGLEVCTGDYIVIFDADMQFSTDDIPPMIEMLDNGKDLIAGYKVGKYQKPFVSSIYNRLGKMLFKVPVKDMNAMKAMRRCVLDKTPFRPDWHRYIVVWAFQNGFDIDEYPVKLSPRRFGKSKYSGFGRVLIGIFDMISVWFQLKFARKPMLFFGTAGLIVMLFAFLLGVLAIILRFGFQLGYRPLLELITMLGIIGIVLFIGGFVGEMIEGFQDKVLQTEKKLKELKDDIEKNFKKKNDK